MLQWERSKHRTHDLNLHGEANQKRHVQLCNGVSHFPLFSPSRRKNISTNSPVFISIFVRYFDRIIRANLRFSCRVSWAFCISVSRGLGISLRGCFGYACCTTVPAAFNRRWHIWSDIILSSFIALKKRLHIVIWGMSTYIQVYFVHYLT